MALSKKKSRKINVNGTIYRWKAIFNYEQKIAISIELEKKPGNRIETNINSENYSIRDRFKIYDDGTYSYGISPQIKITPVIIKRIILLAINLGWDPYLIGKPYLILNIENKIDFNLSEEILEKIEFSKEFTENLVKSHRNKCFNNENAK